MNYYFIFGGQKFYGKNKNVLRWKILMCLAVTNGNMEMMVPIFSDDGLIAELDYLKELHGRVYFCYEDCRQKRTMRTYYPLDDTNLIENHDVCWMEIFSMRDKQLLAKDIYA